MVRDTDLDKAALKQGPEKGVAIDNKDHAEHQKNVKHEQVAMASTDKHLPKAEISHDLSDCRSEAPKNPPILDKEGRVTAIKYEDGKTREFKYGKNGLTDYKDKDGHVWHRNEKNPNEWIQTDGSSKMHGRFRIDEKGRFYFHNDIKKHVSHYDANGNEKNGKNGQKDGHRDYSSYSAEEKGAISLQAADFCATGKPQQQRFEEITPEDKAKMTTAERDSHDVQEAGQFINNAAKAVENAADNAISFLPDGIRDVAKAAKDVGAGFLGTIAQDVSGIAKSFGYNPEDPVVRAAQDAAERTMNKHLGTLNADDHIGHFIRDGIVRNIGRSLTPIVGGMRMMGAMNESGHEALEHWGKHGLNTFGQFADAVVHQSAREWGGSIAKIAEIAAPVKGLGALKAGTAETGMLRIGMTEAPTVRIFTAEEMAAQQAAEASAYARFRGGTAWDTLRAQKELAKEKAASPIEVVEGEVVE